MKINYELNLKQEQKLIMTPELRQAIELLQLNTIELREYLDQELEENPLLELESKDEEIDWAEYFKSQRPVSTEYNRDNEEIENTFENILSEPTSKLEEISFQINTQGETEEEIKIANTLIRCLDENGYLPFELEDLVKASDYNLEEIKSGLKLLQNIEPKGIGAKNLKETLLLQIEEDYDYYEEAKEIIENHMEDIAFMRIGKISKALNTKIGIVNGIINYIKNLNPRPGKGLISNMEDVEYVLPDAEIKEVDGEFKVFLREESSPRLRINNQYKDLITKGEDKKAAEYVNERMKRAVWVIRSIEQRKETIRNILESIVKYQEEFFRHGKFHLKPLVMKEVADDIKMHESTVSRASTDKYVQTPYGVFKIKYFFTTGLSSSDGEVSRDSIQILIQDMVDSEDKTKPLSDQKISNKLFESGIKISRRTVAKYRDELGILSSNLRRG